MSRALARRQDPLTTLFDSMFQLPWYEKEDHLKSKVDSNNECIIFTLEVPGFEENEIDIELKDRNLQITAERQLPTGLACGLVKSQLGNCPVGRHTGD